MPWNNILNPTPLSQVYNAYALGLGPPYIRMGV